MLKPLSYTLTTTTHVASYTLYEVLLESGLWEILVVYRLMGSYFIIAPLKTCYQIKKGKHEFPLWFVTPYYPLFPNSCHLTFPCCQPHLCLLQLPTNILKKLHWFCQTFNDSYDFFINKWWIIYFYGDYSRKDQLFQECSGMVTSIWQFQHD